RPERQCAASQYEKPITMAMNTRAVAKPSRPTLRFDSSRGCMSAIPDSPVRQVSDDRGASVRRRPAHLRRETQRLVAVDDASGGRQVGEGHLPALTAGKADGEGRLSR